MKPLNFCQKTLVRQQGQADCGVACLLSLIKYYEGAEKSLEDLRNLSGTNMQGTTLLGLYEAGKKLGFETEGCQATIEALQNHPSPTILHVLIENRLQHYVICYGWDKKRQKFVIGDPAKGVYHLSIEELNTIWVSKNLLTLEVTESFEAAKAVRKVKRDWLIDLLKEDSNLLLTSAFMGVLISILGLTMSFFTQKLIDDILPERKTTELTVALLFLGILLLIKAGVTYLRGIFMARQTKDFNNRIISKFFDKLLFLPVRFFDQRKTGEMITRMNDTGRLQRVISHLASNLFIDLLIVLVFSIYLFNIHWQVGLIAVLMIPVYIWIAWRNNSAIIQNQKKLMESYASTESQYISSVQGIRTIKSSRKEAYFSEQTNKVYRFFQDQQFGLAKIQAKVGGIMEAWSVIFSVLIISWGAYAVLQEVLSIGELMAILTVALNIAPSVIRLSLVNISISEARIAFDRMYEFVGLQPENSEKGQSLSDKVESLTLQHVEFRFPGRKAILRSVNMRIPANSITGISGDSGSGKSTLLQLLQKFYEPTQGQILVNNTTPLNKLVTSEWRLKVGVVAQDITLFPGSLLENICLSSEKDELEKVVAFCQKSGFHELIMKFPQNYLTILGENGENLSGGQKQIVALARALYKKPELLLLDEPTAALDMRTEQFVMNLLQKLKKEMTIVVVSHRTVPLELADHCYLLESGSVKETTTV